MAIIMIYEICTVRFTRVEHVLTIAMAMAMPVLWTTYDLHEFPDQFDVSWCY